MKVRMSKIDSAGRHVEFDDPEMAGWMSNVEGLGSGYGLVYRGVRFSRKQQEELGYWTVPWAWAINGTVSVISAVAAALLALSFGFAVVIRIGAMAYGVAAFFARSNGAPVILRRG